MALPHHKVQASKAYAPSTGMQAALMGLSQEGTWQSINTQGVRRQKEPILQRQNQTTRPWGADVLIKVKCVDSHPGVKRVGSPDCLLISKVVQETCSFCCPPR